MVSGLFGETGRTKKDNALEFEWDISICSRSQTAASKLNRGLPTTRALVLDLAPAMVLALVSVHPSHRL
jgi:hypothetical protein